MKQIIIYSNEFSVPDNSYSFLSKYLDRIRKFINSNSLDIDLLNDIEERISEKFFSIIDVWIEISEKDVIDIVNEIWEPEDIFKDFIQKKENTNIGGSDFSQKVKSTLKAKLYKNSKKWIIFWVCQWFWEYFEINPVWIRILFLFLFFFYWTWILIYIILWIILPEKDEEVGLDIEKNVQKAAERVKEVANQWFIINFFHAIWRFIENIFRLIGRLIWFWFLWFVGFVLLFLWIGWIIFSAFLNNSYTINNEILFYYVPPYLMYSGLIFSIVCFLFGIIAFFASFKRQLANWYVFLTLFIILAGSGFGITSWLFKTFASYMNEYSNIEKHELWVVNSWTTIKISSFGWLINRDEPVHIFDFDFPVKIIETDSNTLSIEVTSRVRANNKVDWDMIFANLIPVSAIIKDNEIIFPDSINRFKTPQPFSFLRRELIVRLPKNISLDIRWAWYNWFYLNSDNIWYSDDMVKYGVDWCYNSIISYDYIKQKLTCNDIDWVNNAKNGYNQ